MIENYDFGSVWIDGKEHTSDIICYQDKVVSWWRETGHRVSRNDIVDLVRNNPDVIVIGAGAHGMVKVPDDTRKYIRENDIRLIVKRTDEAVHSYNTLDKNGENVAIAMHLTC